MTHLTDWAGHTQLLRRYNFSLIDPLEPMKIRGAIAWMAHDFWVKVEKRVDSADSKSNSNSEAK